MFSLGLTLITLIAPSDVNYSVLTVLLGLFRTILLNIVLNKPSKFLGQQNYFQLKMSIRF